MMRYLTVLAVLTTGCVKHIESYAPRTRDWSKIETKRLDDAHAPKPSPGSLFVDDGDDLFAYRRATRTGDVVTVRIDEQSLADGEANTNLDRQSSYQAGVTAMLGLMNQLATADDRITCDHGERQQHLEVQGRWLERSDDLGAGDHTSHCRGPEPFRFAPDRGAPGDPGEPRRAPFLHLWAGAS